MAQEEHVTGKGHIWIVSQSIVGDLDKESKAPTDFPTGLLGKSHFNLISVKFHFLNRKKHHAAWGVLVPYNRTRQEFIDFFFRKNWCCSGTKEYVTKTLC